MSHLQSSIATYRQRLIAAVLLLVTLLPGHLSAQDDVEYRMEVGGAVGIDAALTDANSRLFGAVGMAGGALVRFVLNPRMAVKVGASYARLSGATTDVDHFYPATTAGATTERLDYRVSGGLTDVSALYELHFLPYGYIAGYQGFRRLTPYIEMGLGCTYSDAGNAFTVNIPLGAGLKYKAGRRLNLGLEWRMHLSLSDRLEGLKAPLGISSSGFKNKDHYALTLFTVTYDISPQCPECNKDRR